MSEKPLVSILIPVYMRANLAIQAIYSALKQDYENIEIIVVDNKSSDGTYERLCEEFKNNNKVIFAQNEKNLGAVGNWERCLERAGGKYIKYLWSDDLMSKDFISRAVDFLESDCEVAFVFSSVYIFTDERDLNNDETKFCRQYRLKKQTGVYPGKDFIKASYCCRPSVPVSPGCAVFRKEKLHLILDIPNKIGYVHRKNGAGPDVLMFLEALAHGEKFAYIDEACCYFRNHEGSITTFDKTINDGYWTARQYYLKKYHYEQYWNALNSEIISTINRKKIFSKKNNMKVLNTYLEISDHHIKMHSVLGVFVYKIRCKIYVSKRKRKG